MSTGTSYNWRAAAEEERREQARLRAELAALGEQERQLERREVRLAAVRGRAPGVPARVVDLTAVDDALSSTDLRARVTAAHRALAGRSAALERETAQVHRLVDQPATGDAAAGPGADGAGTASIWATPVREQTSSGQAGGSSPRRAGEPRARSGTSGRAQDAGRPPSDHAPAAADAPATTDPRAAAEEAARVLRECRVRCPEADVSAIEASAAQIAQRPQAAQVLLTDVRVRAAQVIQRTKQQEAAAQQRSWLACMVEEIDGPERRDLAARLTTAPAQALPWLEREILAAVEEASARRARRLAVEALRDALADLDYEVSDGFQTLLPEDDTTGSADEVSGDSDRGAPPSAAAPSRGAQTGGQVAVVPSRHHRDLGLRIRLHEDRLDVTLVRRSEDPGSEVPRLRATQDEEAAQRQTCQDLAAVVTLAASQGVDLGLTVRRLPGNAPPPLDARLWPTSQQDDVTRRRRAAHAAQQQATRQAVHRSPGGPR